MFCEVVHIMYTCSVKLYALCIHVLCSCTHYICMFCEVVHIMYICSVKLYTLCIHVL